MIDLKDLKITKQFFEGEYGHMTKEQLSCGVSMCSSYMLNGFETKEQIEKIELDLKRVVWKEIYGEIEDELYESKSPED